MGFSLRGNIGIHKRKTYSFYFDDSREVFNLFGLYWLEEREDFNRKILMLGRSAFGFLLLRRMPI